MLNKLIIFAIIIALFNFSCVSSQPNNVYFFSLNETIGSFQMTTFNLAGGDFVSYIDLNLPTSINDIDVVLNVDSWGNFYLLGEEDNWDNNTFNIIVVSKTGQLVNISKEIIESSSNLNFEWENVQYDPVNKLVLITVQDENDNTVLYVYNFETLTETPITLGVSPNFEPIGSYDASTGNYYTFTQGEGEYNYTLVTYNVLSKSIAPPVQIQSFEQDLSSLFLQYYQDNLYIISHQGWTSSNFTLYLLDAASGLTKELYWSPSENDDYSQDYWFADGFVVFVAQPSIDSETTTVTTVNLNTFASSVKTLNQPFPITQYTASWAQ